MSRKDRIYAILFVALLLVLYLRFSGLLGLERGLPEYLASFGEMAPLAFLALMVLQAVVAPLPAAPLAMAGGYIFGIYKGALLAWVGAAFGASLCFYLGRRLGRPFAIRMVGEEGLREVDSMASGKGFYAILVARLLPLISFDVVSYGAGLTRMPFAAFLLATLLGMIPGTILYTYAGTMFAHEGPFHAIATLVLLLILFALPLALRRGVAGR